jgi:hypothetical protein
VVPDTLTIVTPTTVLPSVGESTDAVGAGLLTMTLTSVLVPVRPFVVSTVALRT